MVPADGLGSSSVCSLGFRIYRTATYPITSAIRADSESSQSHEHTFGRVADDTLGARTIRSPVTTTPDYRKPPHAPRRGGERRNASRSPNIKEVMFYCLPDRLAWQAPALCDHQ
jgi:hypothetical protein